MIVACVVLLAVSVASVLFVDEVAALGNQFDDVTIEQSADQTGVTENDVVIGNEIDHQLNTDASGVDLSDNPSNDETFVNITLQELPNGDQAVFSGVDQSDFTVTVDGSDLNTGDFSVTSTDEHVNVSVEVQETSDETLNVTSDSLTVDYGPVTEANDQTFTTELEDDAGDTIDAENVVSLARPATPEYEGTDAVNNVSFGQTVTANLTSGLTSSDPDLTNSDLTRLNTATLRVEEAAVDDDGLLDPVESGSERLTLDGADTETTDGEVRIDTDDIDADEVEDSDRLYLTDDNEGVFADADELDSFYGAPLGETIRLTEQSFEPSLEETDVTNVGSASRTDLEFDDIDPDNRDLSFNVTAAELSRFELLSIFAGQANATVALDNAENQTTGPDGEGFDNPEFASGFGPFDAIPYENENKILLNRTASDANGTLRFADIDPGAYNLSFEVTDAKDFDGDPVNETVNVTVGDEDLGGAFVDNGEATDVYRTPVGDFIEITASLSGSDTGYLILGGDQPVGGGSTRNYLDLLYLEPEGNEVTFTLNTRLIGTNADPENVILTELGDTVVSYAHEEGATTQFRNTNNFQGLTVQTEDGNAVGVNSLSQLRQRLEISGLPRPLQPGRYRLVVSSDPDIVLRDDDLPGVSRDEVADFDDPLGRSNLLLTSVEQSGMTTYVAPMDDADEQESLEEVLAGATRRQTVAEGDRLIIEINTTGTYGALFNSTGGSIDNLVRELEEGSDPENLADGSTGLLDKQEGVSLSMNQTSPAVNQPQIVTQFAGRDSDELYLLFDAGLEENSPQIDALYLVMDTRDGALFSDDLDFDGAGEGNRFEINFSYLGSEDVEYQFQSTGAGVNPQPFAPVQSSEQFPYLRNEDTRSMNRSVEFEDPVVEYRLTRDDDLLLRPEENWTIRGETNVAPGTDATLQLLIGDRDDPEFITIDNASIGSDGRFNSTHNLSELSVGEEVTTEFYTDTQVAGDRPQRLIDERTGVVVSEDETPQPLTIVELTGVATVTQNDPLTPITAIFRNDGEVEATRVIEFDLAGETRSEREVTLQPGETVTLNFDDVTADLEPGEYGYTVQVPPNDQAGTLIVERGERAVFEVSTPEPQSVTVQRGDPVTVTAVIANTGNAGATRTATLTANGSQLASQEVRLESGGETTVTFERVDTSVLEPGEYNYTVNTGDGVGGGTLQVEAAVGDGGESGESDDDTDESDGPDEPDDGSGFIPTFGIGLPELAGAALLLGLLHAVNQLAV